MKNLTKLDQTIVKTLLVICCIGIIYSLVFHLPITLKVIAIIGGLAYLFFILMHLGLGYPLFVVIMGTSDIWSCLSMPKAIRERSEILYKLSLYVAIFIVLCIVYYFIPVILSMAYCNTWDYNEASSALNNLMKQ